MHNLTQRQIEILRAIIEEYIETAEAVGSETLEKKHNLSASPATIRNEMVRLAEMGYIKKLHSSAGRVPTPQGMKFYVRELMKEKELSTVEEVKLKAQVWDYRNRMQRFLKEVTKTLAEQTGALALVMTDEGDMYCSGYANILDMPEFYDIDITKNLLATIDEYEYFRELFSHVPQNDEDVHILLGEDLGTRLKGPYGFVYTRYQAPDNFSGEVGVMGPVRLNYTSVVPTVRYFADLIEEISRS